MPPLSQSLGEPVNKHPIASKVVRRIKRRDQTKPQRFIDHEMQNFKFYPARAAFSKIDIILRAPFFQENNFARS